MPVVHGFASKTAATAATIPSDVVTITIDAPGYTANYRKVASQPSHPGKLQSTDGAWWELSDRVVSPQMFGAAGNAAMNITTGAVTGTDDTAAFDSMRQFCVATRAQVLLTSQYIYSGTFEMWPGVTITGANSDQTGVYINIDNTKEGFHVLTQDGFLSNFFISARIPTSIQNGQGNFGTCITFGKVYYPVPARNVGESAEAYGKRSTPDLGGNFKLKDMVFRRRPGGSGHAIAVCGRSSGIVIENPSFEGWSAATGYHANALLTHWGGVADVFESGDDGVLIEPLIFRKADDSYTFHPNNVRMFGGRIRCTGRIASIASSYDVHIHDMDIDGKDDSGLVIGSQVALVVGGDDGDLFACPDDKGKVYANVIVENITAFNMDGRSPNPVGTGMLDFPGYATSKYINADGSLARNDPGTITKNYNPPSIPAGGTHTVDVAVTGAITADSARAGAWFSKLGSIVTLSASVPSANTVRVVFSNPSASPVDLPAGTLNAYVGKPRLQQAPLWTGFRASNWRVTGLGTTGAMINIRNARVYGVIENIHADGIGTVDGLAIQNTTGKLTCRNLFLNGANILRSVEGISIMDSTLKTTTTVSLTATAALHSVFDRGLVITGAPPFNVTGTILERASSTVLRVRIEESPWNTFQVGEVVSGGGQSFTITGTGVAPYDNRCVDISGDTVNVALGLELGVRATEVTVAGTIGKDVRPGDRLVSTKGILYAREYHDASEKVIKIEPAPFGLDTGEVLVLDRLDYDVSFTNTTIIGGDRGINVESRARVLVRGGIIRDTGVYGAYAGDYGVLDLEGVTFSNNGQRRVMLDTEASTRDVTGGVDGTIRVEGCDFKHGAWINHNILANGSSRGGSIRDNFFTPTGSAGAPISGYLNVVNPQTDGGWLAIDNNRDANGILVGPGIRIAFATINPASVAANTTGSNSTITVAGAALGDIVAASFSLPLGGLILEAWGSAADTVTYHFRNPTGSAIDLGSGKLTVSATRY